MNNRLHNEWLTARFGEKRAQEIIRHECNALEKLMQILWSKEDSMNLGANASAELWEALYEWAKL